MARMERCTRCGAASVGRWSKPGYELYLCGHHTRVHRLRLIAEGWAMTRAKVPVSHLA